MFQIYQGAWRGIGADEQSTTFINIGIKFRQCLHHFQGARLSVLLAIALHMDQAGVAFPSYETLQKETGYSRGAIAKALTDLCAMDIEGQRVLVKWRDPDEARQQYAEMGDWGQRHG